jgi:FAD-dependent oxidoreductase domain-containing protein 1
MVADVVIVGGGAVGSSIAYHLRTEGFDGRVVVVERDPSYARASSALAVGGVRQQYGSRINVQMAQFSLAFLERFDELLDAAGLSPRVQFQQRGYLFLVDRANADRFQRRFALAREHGAHVERLSVDEIRRRVPGLLLDDIEFGVFGPKDGYLDPTQVLAGLRAVAERAGAEYVHADVTGIERSAGRVTAVVLSGTGGPDRVDSPIVVNAAGPYAAAVARLARVDLAVHPVRQHLFRCELARPWPHRYPMMFDPNGVHWRNEDPPTVGAPDRIIVGRSDPGEPAGENFIVDLARYESELLPTLRARLPELGDLRLATAHAGLYEMSPDHNAIIGEHPDLGGFLLANGFSGHGLMMSPATGRILSELIRLGRSETFDIRPFSPTRFARGELFRDDSLI